MPRSLRGHASRAVNSAGMPFASLQFVAPGVLFFLSARPKFLKSTLSRVA